MLKFPNLMASGKVPCHMLLGDVCHRHLVRPLVCQCEKVLTISSCCCFLKCLCQSFLPENAPVEMSDKVSLLAIAWDREIQVANLLKSKLKVLEKWTLESAAIGLAWLGDQVNYHLCSLSKLDFMIELEQEISWFSYCPDVGHPHFERTTLFVFKRWEFDSPD